MNNIKRVTIAKEIEDPYYLKEPTLIELYKKCLPPRDAYYYFPKGEEIVIYNQKKPHKTFRRIFYNVPFNDQEKQWIEEFKNIIKSHPETQLPDYFDDYLHLTFIYATSCNMKESYKKLVNYLKFCKETFPLLITPNSKLREILNKGFVYIYGRDNRFRPIIIVQCKVFQKFYKNYKTEEILQAVYFLCQFLCNNMIIPGQFESWNMIINLKDVSVISLPEPIKKMIPALSDYFLSRLYKNFIIGLNFLTRIIFKIACNFLDEITIKKINILDKKNDPKLFQTIRRDNIEQMFGGTAPNLPVDSEDGFFPPRMPSENFMKDDENPKDILISEDEYIQKYKNGEIPEGCLSPYLYDKIKEEENAQQEIINPPEPIEENISQNINNGEQIRKSYKSQKSMKSMEKEYKIQNEQIFRNKPMLLKNNYNINKINRFINCNWNFDDELSFPKYHYINTSALKEGNILDDINKFGLKKKNFTSKISIFNNKHFSYFNN